MPPIRSTRILAILLAALVASAVSCFSQSIRSLGFNTTNGQVVYSGTNTLTFTNNVNFDSGDVQFNTTQIIGNGLYIDFDDGAIGGVITLDANSSIGFQGASAAITRTNLSLGATWLTNTNATNFRTGVGLGSSSAVTFREVSASEGFTGPTNGKGFLVSQGGGIRSTTNSLYSSSPEIEFMAYAVSEVGRFVSNGIVFTAENSFLRFGTNNTNGSAITRTNLGLPLPAITNDSNVTMMRALAGSTNTNHPFSGSVSVVGTNNTNLLVFTNGILSEVQ